MELKPGYKQTEVGVIPEEWDVTRLGDIGEALIGLTYRPENVTSEGLLVLRSSNILDGELYFEDNVFVDMDVPDKIIVKKGDILICVRNGSRELIGKCAQIDKNAEGMTFGAFMAVFRTPFHDFIFQQFQSNMIKRQIHEHLGATINQITNKSLNSFSVPMPKNVAEQHAIATSLGDVSALISSLEKLIAKKRDIKQATMQQLITGKKRLSGFSGEWEVKRLGDVSWYQEGPGVRNYQFTKDGIKLLNGTNIVNGKVVLDTTNRYISAEEAFGCYKHFLVDDGDILIASSGVTIDKFHEKVAIATSKILPLCMNTSTIRFKTNSSELREKYLYFFLQSDLFKDQIRKQATGSAQLNFGPAHLKKINVKLPPRLEEQTAITAVLSDMDAEIAALEARLAKTRDLKQGMMQELLTGRTRLV